MNDHETNPKRETHGAATPRSRRRFLRALAMLTAATGAGGYWVASSRQRSARWLRQIAKDVRRGVQPAPTKPRPREWPDNAITMAWLGHATVLINFFGVRILTDPSFFSRIGVGFGLGTLGPKRYVGCALKAGELPEIDLVLLSHAHMDHIDLPSLARLPKATQTVSASVTEDVIRTSGLKNIVQLKWNDRTRLKFRAGELEIEAFEVKHWGQRWPNGIDRGYNGYVLRREGKALLFGGDTAHTRLFWELRAKGPFEAAVMPIGAYQPWIRNHCTPEQAVQMADGANARYVVPVHHLAFKLSDEPMTEPIERLTEALQFERQRIALQRVGETFTCPKA